MMNREQIEGATLDAIRSIEDLACLQLERKLDTLKEAAAAWEKNCKDAYKAQERADVALDFAVSELKEMASSGCQGDADWPGCKERMGQEEQSNWCWPCRLHEVALKAEILRKGEIT